MRTLSQPCWQLENLETRQLLSASVGVAPLASSGPALIQPLAVRNASIVGTFTGTSTKRGTRKAKSLTIDITSESRRGALVGTATSGDGAQNFTGTITGNSFTVTIVTGSGSVTVTGTVSVKGKVTTLAGTSSGSGSRGTFSVSN